jgi:hypothetical protein
MRPVKEWCGHRIDGWFRGRRGELLIRGVVIVVVIRGHRG